MNPPVHRISAPVFIFYAFLFWASSGTAQQQEQHSPQSLTELGDSQLENARRVWEKSLVDTRQVADVVCLVPNRETFLQALGNWDDTTYFPILIDDTELTLKFIAAFKPKRVVRFPVKVPPIPDENLWPASMTSALRGILPVAKKPNQMVPGNMLWLQKEPRSPGLVLTKNDENAVAAAALAAGHKQGMALWPEDKKWGDVMTVQEASSRAATLEKIVEDLKIKADGIGDDLDFITLTGDMPYRYSAPQGENCLDDLMGRKLSDSKAPRWAFTGRIRGTLNQQIYMVMCALFLQPGEAQLFSGYDGTDKRFKDYSLSLGKSRLDSFGMRTSLAREGDLNAWRRTFFPMNEAGLLIINTSGNPTSFNLQGGTAGTTWDVPWTVPTRVHIIHSFSAADASDPYTIAGRWLANGAYGYFGSVNEPYLQSFRTSGLLTDCLTQGYPWAAAVRQNPGVEMFGQPWRLIVFGDPMMRLIRPENRQARIDSPMLNEWPSFKPEPVPAPGAEPPALLGWAVRQSIMRHTNTDEKEHIPAKQIIEILQKMDRTALPQEFRSIRDELIASSCLEAKQYQTLVEMADEIPRADMTASLTRMIESAAVVVYLQGTSRGNLEDLLPAWRVLVQLCPRGDLRDAISNPIKPMTTTAVRRRIWIRTLEKITNTSENSQELKDWANREIALAESAKN